MTLKEVQALASYYGYFKYTNSYTYKRKGIKMISFSEIQTFVLVLMALCGTVITLGSAVNLIIKWKKQSKTEKHELMIRDHEERLKELEKDKKEKDGFTKVMCNSMLALLNHNINGNSKDKLEKAKEELQNFLVSK